MIEIQPGWTAVEATIKTKVRDAEHILGVYKKRVEQTENELLKLREDCTHKHVKFNGQDMFCDVCGVRLHQ